VVKLEAVLLTLWGMDGAMAAAHADMLRKCLGNGWYKDVLKIFLD
jgi:hypothetical protein